MYGGGGGGKTGMGGDMNEEVSLKVTEYGIVLKICMYVCTNVLGNVVTKFS